jgi:hypothetical protein
MIATWNALGPDNVNFVRTAEESYKKRVETLQMGIQIIASRFQIVYY